MSKEFVDDRDAFAERLIGAVTDAMDVMGVYLGDRLGLYTAPKEAPATAAELAQRAGTAPRITREWLEAQAASGIIRLVNAGAAPDDRRYELTPGHAEVLLDRDSLAYVGPIARLFVGATSPLSICSGVRETLVATAASPRVVARANGMANHARPPIRNPFTADLGLAAIAFCQYAWSTKMVPKLPTILIIPNINAPVEAIVRYAPSEFPATGLSVAALVNFSYIPPTPPNSGFRK